MSNRRRETAIAESFRIQTASRPASTPRVSTGGMPSLENLTGPKDRNPELHRGCTPHGTRARRSEWIFVAIC